MKDISNIYNVSDEELTKKADEYINAVGKDMSDTDKERAKEFYISNAKKNLNKMRTKTVVKMMQQQKKRQLAKQRRKQNVRRIRSGR